jgi:hypothetical protein
VAPRRQSSPVAASLFTPAYHMLKGETCYCDLGPDHFDRRSKKKKTQQLLKRLAHLGYAAALTPIPLPG